MAVEKLRYNDVWKHFVRELKRLDAYNNFLESCKMGYNFETIVIDFIHEGYKNLLSPKRIIDWNSTKEGYAYWSDISDRMRF